MRYFSCIALVFLVAGCTPSKTQSQSANIDTTTVVAQPAIVNKTDDQSQIQDLIRKMLIWSQKHEIDLLPAIQKDTLYIGFDIVKLDKTIEQLKATNFFSATFTKNYKQIILQLDKQIRNKERYEWNVNDMPPFAFATGSDPWCNCQDVPYDEPNAYELVEVYPVNTTKGDWIWKWGSLKPKTDPSWKEFSYKFKVEKENGDWKISYLQGFDSKEST